MNTDSLLRLMAERLPGIARAAVPVPTKRLGTVAAAGTGTGTSVSVLVDGDTTAVSILNGTGRILPAGVRVWVDFYPPHGAVVTGLAGPPGELLWPIAGIHTDQVGTGLAGENSSATFDGVEFAAPPSVRITMLHLSTTPWVYNLRAVTTTGFDFRVVTATGTVTGAPFDYEIHWDAVGVIVS